MVLESTPAGPFGDTTASSAARAPGRVNLIGEHTDYNQGLVLPVAIGMDTRVRLRFRSDERVRGRSREQGVAEASLGAAAAGDWLDYARGVAQVLAAERRIPALGFEIEVESDLPQGAGLSSSAALEAATAVALLAAAGAPLRDTERPQLAELCRRAEAEFVGVPCGIMDQYASLCARRDGALLLDCASGRTEHVPLPEGVALLVFDTLVRRELRDGGYARRREECARALGEATRVLGRPLASLSQLGPGDLDKIGGRIDALSFRRARHVTTENARVREFSRRLHAADLRGAGDALYASHESLRFDYEVSWPEADALVADTHEIAGGLGARMLGAGWGGCTLHLVEAEHAERFAERLAERFAKRAGRPPNVWRTHAAERAGRLPSP